MKVWYISCWLLFVHSIISLINERYDVVYHLEDSKNERFAKDRESALVVCIDLKEIFRNKTQIQLKSLHKNLIFYFKNKDFFSLFGSGNMYKRLIIKAINSRHYFIFKDSLCLKMETSLIGFDSFLGIEWQKLFAINENTLQYTRLGESDEGKKIGHLKVLNLQYPYSNCSKSSSFFKCINDCAKKASKVSKYYYGNDELKGSIYLEYQRNVTLLEKEKECVIRCKKEGYSCEIDYFITIGKEYDEEGERRLQVFQANPLITEFEFYIQLIGLAFFFTNMHLSKLINILIRFIKIKIKKIKVVKIKK